MKTKKVRAEQFNFYVHPVKEERMHTFLKNFPDNTRSAFIKALVTHYMDGNPNPAQYPLVPPVPGFNSTPIQIPSQPQSNVLRATEEIDIDLEDI
ncbi:hypothetical protein [Bacillus phage YungSlug]|nr:hypothetical protein [Bacillus phage YungSlug]